MKYLFVQHKWQINVWKLFSQTEMELFPQFKSERNAFLWLSLTRAGHIAQTRSIIRIYSQSGAVRAVKSRSGESELWPGGGRDGFRWRCVRGIERSSWSPAGGNEGRSIKAEHRRIIWQGMEH